MLRAEGRVSFVFVLQSVPKAYMGVSLTGESYALCPLLVMRWLFSPRPIDREDARDGWPWVTFVNDACQRRVLNLLLVLHSTWLAETVLQLLCGWVNQTRTQ